MMSKTAVHALRAVAALAGVPEGEFEGTARLAKAIGAPPNYLGKLLQVLAQTGVVVSQKGLGGGFRLARRPERIRLYDVVEPIDHASRRSGCLMDGGRCSEENPCILHDRWAQVRDAYFRMLEESTIADLLGRRKPPREGRKIGRKSKK